MKWMEKRGSSFIIVALVYVLASLVGITVYTVLSFSWRWNLLFADVAATAFTFLFSVLLKNASVYDPYWSVQPLVILWALSFFYPLQAVDICVLIVVTLWGVRLTANWAYTFYGLRHQDWRYTMLQEKTGRFYPFVNFIGIHMVPTLVVYACILPAAEVIVTVQSNAPLYAMVAVGLCVSSLAVLLQGISDCQMHAFRKKKRAGQASGFMRSGLWKRSRHPNYLGEILMWWGIAVAAFFATWQWWVFVGAIANTMLFLFVSIPMADKRQSKKEGFAEYKRETRALLPI